MADKDRLQTHGRKANAAQPLDAAKANAGPERYPKARADDAVEKAETRSFAPSRRTSPPADEGRLGPAGDPAEGKR